MDPASIASNNQKQKRLGMIRPNYPNKENCDSASNELESSGTVDKRNARLAEKLALAEEMFLKESCESARLRVLLQEKESTIQVLYI